MTKRELMEALDKLPDEFDIVIALPEWAGKFHTKEIVKVYAIDDKISTLDFAAGTQELRLFPGEFIREMDARDSLT